MSSQPVRTQVFTEIHGGGTRFITPPATSRYVIQWVMGFNASAVGPEAVQLVSTASGATILQRSLGPQSDVQAQLKAVVDYPNSIEVICEANVDAMVTGFELTLP